MAVEVRLRASACHASTLYVGGGTPTALPLELLARLLRGPATPWALVMDAEVTVEANPDDVSRPLLETLHRCGVNRLSLGIQSFCDDELRFLGRRHTASQARMALALAQDAGFANVGFDLMYGFRGQRRDRWRRTLDEALRWRPAHLSCYQLTIEPGTPFARLPRARVRVPEAKEYEFFLLTSRLLTEAGYEHYEVSNFALPGFRARHNAGYWQHAPYQGLGPSAHSFDGRTRSWNVRSADDYIARLGHNALPVEGSETLSDEQIALEGLMLGFRTDRGVPMSALGRYAGWEATLHRLQAGGFVTSRGDRIVPTLAGLAIGDRLPLEFAP